MGQLNTESLKEQLLTADPRYRELAKEHKRYEDRLSQLAALAFPNDDELLEEKSLKKQKLYVKDQMENILQRYRSQVGT